MAVRQVRTCDVKGKKGPCGKDAVAEEIGYDGRTFEIDVCTTHRDDLFTALQPFAEVARQVGKTTGKKKAAAPTVDNAAVREWLTGQGIEVSPKGRIPNKHIEAFRAATGA